ncbi:MAG: DNA topology modulation protein FlaR [Clostridia bacterium]|nr:DNA topology modulation protein FlaR [Clostridia bacterium]
MKIPEISKSLDRVAIIGYAGSGKSTLARKFGAKMNAEVLHIDRAHWLSGWQERERAERDKIVKDFLDKNERWVIDGTYSSLEPERRMAEADLIIFMSFNRFSCLARAIRRKRAYKGKSRPSITEGCEERINREFFWWLVWTGRSKKRREKYKKMIQGHEKKTIIVRNQRELSRLEKHFSLPSGAN